MFEDFDMATANRPNRKAPNEEIIRLNALGLSLATIAERYNCHPTSITLRLKSLGIRPADTRRGFMEDVWMKLPQSYQDSVSEVLVSGGYSIKEYVQKLISDDVLRRSHNQPSEGTAPSHA